MTNQGDNIKVGKERTLRGNYNLFISENSKHNPFGPNSLHSPYEEKMTYKYNMMKEFIRMTRKDELIKEYEESRLIGTMILGFVGGYFGALGICLLAKKVKIMKPQYTLFQTFLFSTLMTGGFGYTYITGYDRYNTNVRKYFLQKYLPQAIQNGFEDYEISR